MSFRFIHVGKSSGIALSLLCIFRAGRYSTGGSTCLFMQSSVNGHVGFHVLAIVSNAAVTLGCSSAFTPALFLLPSAHLG